MAPRVSTPSNGSRGKSRKEIRKESKQFKKLRNAAFSQKKNLEKVIVEKLGDPDLKDKKKKKTKAERKAARLAREAAGLPVVHQPKKKEKNENKDNLNSKEFEKYQKEVEFARRKREKELAKKEQKEIDKYAKKLGFKNTNNVPLSLENEGLGYILEMCDRTKRSEVAEKEAQLKGKEKKEKKNGKDRKKVIDDDDDEMDDFDDDGSEMDEEEEMDDLEKELMGGSDDDDDDDEDEEDEEMEVDLEGEEDQEDEEEEDDEGSELDDEGMEKKKKKKVEEDEIGQDIYGRTINRRTGELIDFNPRAARLKLAQLEATSVDDEERRKIERTVRGVMNLLSESTLVKSAKQIGDLFLANSKNEVKSALTRTLLRLIGDGFRVQDRIMAAYAAFVAFLHATVSSEISAHLIEIFFVETVTKLKDSVDLVEGEAKAMENRMVFTAHLLSFKIIRADLLIELLQRLRENIDQPRLSLILLLIKYAYRPLKRTVNTPLTTFIMDTLRDLEGQMEKYQTQPRMRFLIEELGSIRKTGTTFEQPELDHMLSIYHGLVKKNTDVERELGMSLEDLLQAEERGRWWIVGSAFRLPSDMTRAIGGDSGGGGGKKQLHFDDDVIQLAKRAGMNTEVRRNVFCSVVTAKSEDDAFERLLRLSLKGSQEREIVHILISMLLKEKKFNPFYASLLRRFAEYNRRFVLTIQYALWDRLRELDTMKKEWQRDHIALLHAHLFLYRAIHLTALKVIEWGEMSEATVTCLKKIFTTLKDANMAILTKVFEPILDSRKNRLLTDGLRLFLQMHFDGDVVYAKIENLFATAR